MEYDYLSTIITTQLVTDLTSKIIPKWSYPINTTNGSHLQASSQTYTIMTYGLLLPLFLTFCLIYCLLLTLLQYFLSPDFRSSTHGERVKIVLKLFLHSWSQWRLPNKRVETAGATIGPYAGCLKPHPSCAILCCSCCLSTSISRRSMLLGFWWHYWHGCYQP